MVLTTSGRRYKHRGMEEHGISEYFEEIIDCDETYFRKERRQPLSAVRARAGLKPAPTRSSTVIVLRRSLPVSCPANSCDKLRRILCCRQGAMTCRGGFQTRPSGGYHARKSAKRPASIEGGRDAGLSNMVLTTRGRRYKHRVMEEHGISEYIEEIIDRDQTYFRKERRQPLSAVRARAGFKPAPTRSSTVIALRRRLPVSCPASSCDKLHRIFCCRQGAMTCRGGFQTRPCGGYHARKSNAADGKKTSKY